MPQIKNRPFRFFTDQTFLFKTQVGQSDLLMFMDSTGDFLTCPVFETEARSAVAARHHFHDEQRG